MGIMLHALTVMLFIKKDLAAWTVLGGYADIETKTSQRLYWITLDCK